MLCSKVKIFNYFISKRIENPKLTQKFDPIYSLLVFIAFHLIQIKFIPVISFNYLKVLITIPPNFKTIKICQKKQNQKITHQ